MTPGSTPGPAHELLHYLAQQGKSLSPLLILPHNHPDPDALASAYALAFLAEKLHGIRSRIAYGGVIGRVENQALVRVLGLPVHPLRDGDLKKFPNVALVDTQPPFQNNPFPKNKKPALIVDHHPKNPRTDAGLALIDTTYGATSTLMTEAVLASGVEPPKKLATALLYGIGSETQNLGREASERDVGAYMALHRRASLRSLSRIQNPPRPATFFSTLSKAIQRAFIHRDVIGVHLGEVPNPDLVAQMADFLLSHEGMRWSAATGRFQGRLHISLRSTNPNADAGRLLKRLLGGGTRAGGHAMIAGGSAVVGEAPEEKWREMEDQIIAAFFKALGRGEPELQFPFYFGS